MNRIQKLLEAMKTPKIQKVLQEVLGCNKQVAEQYCNKMSRFESPSLPPSVENIASMLSHLGMDEEKTRKAANMISKWV